MRAQTEASPRAPSTTLGVAIALVWIAAIAFFNTIIGVFGLRPAIVGLALFVALACALAQRSQHVEGRQ